MGDQYLAQRIDEILRQKIAMGAGVQAGWAKGTKLTKKAKEEIRARKIANGVLKAQGKDTVKGTKIKNPYVRKTRAKKVKVVDNGMPKKLMQDSLNIINLSKNTRKSMEVQKEYEMLGMRIKEQNLERQMLKKRLRWILKKLKDF